MTDTPKFVFDIPVKPKNRKTKRHEPVKHRCHVDGCKSPGEFKAPRNPNDLKDYYWFCLDHVREYNRGWDYFKNMSEAEAADFRRDAVTGHRPTSPLGSNPSGGSRSGRMDNLHDPFSIIDDGPGSHQAREAKTRRPKLGKIATDALNTLGLDETATLNEVKARYKELVKRYHPDVNGGDRGAEDRLDRVIRAYKQLQNSGIA